MAGLPEALGYVQVFLEQVPEKVNSLGSLGPVYFFVVYVVAECLALPATPLTLSAGYLFGLPMGCLLAIISGTTAASIGFLLARSLLRPQIEEYVRKNEVFRNINLAVESEGFKIILLLRLSPLLPFAISNYLYGLSSVAFSDFLFATIIGFTPGTCGVVYLATAARDVMNEGVSEPWYVYVGGVAITFGILATVANVAKEAVDAAIAAEEEKQKTPATYPALSMSAKDKAKEPAAGGSWLDGLRDEVGL